MTRFVLAVLLVVALNVSAPCDTIWDVIPTKDFDVCDVVSKRVTIIPCRPFDQLPISGPPVKVDCSDLGWPVGRQRCTELL